MKLLITTLMAALSLNAFAEITTCSGTKNGRDITFTLTSNEARMVEAIEVTVDGALVSKKLTEVRSNSLAGGIMITASEPWAIAINDVSIFVDESRSCFNNGDKGCYLGWVNLFQQGLVIPGIPLICE